VLSFELEGGFEAASQLASGLRLCRLAEHVGTVETLVTHSASMTHADVDPAERRQAGISDGLLRLSVGLEDPRDIIADLQRELAKTAREQRRPRTPAATASANGSAAKPSNGKAARGKELVPCRSR
jgi:hypothetical protein